MDEILQPFRMSGAQLRVVQDSMAAVIRTGMKRPDDQTATSMLPTYVRRLPTGGERGSFLALDLGGTNFRVLQLSFKEGSPVEMVSQTFPIPSDLKTGEGAELFDHIAGCICAFTTRVELNDAVLPPLGFTFSFPCQQTSLHSATLVRWSKGFSARDVEGQDVVKLLREAIERHGGPQLGRVAVLNDTCGTLMSAGFKDRLCRVGFIVGTGTNAAYFEPLGGQIFNTEWGSLGDGGEFDSLILTKFDVQLDEHSKLPRTHILEKMTSGLYMGELVRRILVKLQQTGAIWPGHTGNLLATGVFTTEMMSDVESCWREQTDPTAVWFRLGLWNWTVQDDKQKVREVCKVVAERSADLIGAALSVLIERTGLQQVAVGYDGSVCRHHPTYLKRLEETTSRLLGPDKKFRLVLAEDGSGIGAALTAAQL